MDGRGSNKEILERQLMLNWGKHMPVTREKKKEYKKQFKCTCILDPPQGSGLHKYFKLYTSLLYAHAQILIKQMSF